jgi:hypothetical protein
MGNMFIGSMNYSNQLVRGYFYTRAKEISFYFQDNFKVTPRLTLNLGLRYEYWPALTEKNKLLTGFDPASRSIILGQDLQTMYDLGATFPAVVEQFESLGVKFISYQEAGRSQNLTTAPKANLGPRLGFAYRVGDGARSFVLRGGYRISYFRIPARAWQATMRSNTPLEHSVDGPVPHQFDRLFVHTGRDSQLRDALGADHHRRQEQPRCDHDGFSQGSEPGFGRLHVLRGAPAAATRSGLELHGGKRNHEEHHRPGGLRGQPRQ